MSEDRKETSGCGREACVIAPEHKNGFSVKLPSTLDELLSPRRRKVTSMQKRDGRIVPFESKKITGAVIKAARASGQNYTQNVAEEFTEETLDILERNEVFEHSRTGIPLRRDIEDAVLSTFDRRIARAITAGIVPQLGLNFERVYPIVLDVVKNGQIDHTGAFYRTYMGEREEVRAKLVQLPFSVSFDSTDKQLHVHQVTGGETNAFDEEALKRIILERTQVPYDLADSAVKRVERFLVGRTSNEPITTDEVTCIVDAALMERGVPSSQCLGGRRLSLTLEDVKGFIVGRSVENSNIQVNNPEAVNLAIAEMALKQLALADVFDRDVAEAHRKGEIHLHDLGYVDRVYCSAHSVEYVKMFGLDKVVANLNAKSSPARTPHVLNNHLHTLLAAIQSTYAGALGFPMLNTLYGSALLKEVEMVEGFEIIRDERGGVLKKVKRKLRRSTLEAMFEDSAVVSVGAEGETKFEKEDGTMYEFEETRNYKILRGYSKKELKQIAQNLVFGAAQSAFSRGGQTLFIDFNLDLDTPDHVREVPALFLGAEYKRLKKNGKDEWEVIETVGRENSPLRISGVMVDKGHKDSNGKPILEPSHVNGDVKQPEDGTQWATYGHEIVRKASRDFVEALFEVAKDGDKYGNPFNFPKFDVHVGRGTFEDPESLRLLRKACEVTETNDSIYFMYDRGDGMNVAQCCRLRERVTDPSILKNPERMRFCGVQNVSMDLPQVAFKAKGQTLEEKFESTLSEIEKTMVIALKAHTNKRRYIQELFDNPASPLHVMGGKPSDDGTPYIDLAKSTYIIGIVGLNEAVQHITGKQLHEDSQSFLMGLRIISHMYSMKQEFTKRYGMKFVIEETPGESTNRRFAKLDLAQFAEYAKKVVKGSLERDQPYYTNSSHLVADAPVSGLDRVILQSRMNPMIEAGAITHIFTGERENKAEAVFDFVKAGFYNTQSSQIVFSGEHTVCLECGTHVRGLKNKCVKCGNTDDSRLSQKTRVVGYFSDPRGWNKSKQGELLARQATQGYYSGEINSTRDLASEILEQTIEPDKIRIAVVGSKGCTVCDEAMRRVDRFVNGLDVAVKPKIEIVKYDVGTENGRVMAAVYDAPIDSFPTIVMHTGGRFIKAGWEYPYGKSAKGVDTGVIKKMFAEISSPEYKGA
jgi:anaerobic ribonucleoside-triphosphate reductase